MENEESMRMWGGKTMTDYRDHIMSLPRPKEARMFSGRGGTMSKIMRHREKRKEQ